MKRSLILILTVSLGLMPLSGQHADRVSAFSRQGVGYDMSDAQSRAAFLDASKWQMRHSVSMSMGASALGNTSFLTYHNQFYMPLSSRLSFYGNMYWQLQTHASNPVLERINSPAGALYFDANLNYRLGENSAISLGISRYPLEYGYNGYSPIYSPHYSPYYRMMQERPGGLWP
ncbi:MAG: hypothetical protein PHP63_07705 [Candidatus Marinimicrobia bacterium]|nr:hypothetical protein [Candidatus Neomarinimicrobiota bacterium]